ncbi:PREDICTED: butyrophilin subfamily 1 member A1-like [Acanthisitta chloris]|uniref:butyrophilin subfamily 1 member A1-like n=1 Tax=Acanthisitta chloris TaxID=57068 RepID=UPI0004F0D670|nr:PREDICTED: butyrophilin subfamily 1 member A1-like [Acanthisitta chloris]
MGSKFQPTLLILVLLQMIPWISGQYDILPPDNPVIGVIGRGVVLPCQLTVPIIPERLSVQWHFDGGSKRTEVASYDGTNAQSPVQEDKDYLGRTNFFWSEFNGGNLSLFLKNVKPSDKGKYTCNVFYENWYNEVIVDLDVAGETKNSFLLLPMEF